ncbi:MAG: T9SS type A sorting domain-containing protein [Flavobacteriales bacterium]|nr:T9SS type A sorting domain-containing protein [Flavobacteriales bacterium]
MKIYRSILLLFFTFIQLIGVSQNDSNLVSIFPNPADSVATHLINIKDNDVLKLSLLDRTGNTIYNLTKKCYNESIELTSQISSVKKGIYYSRIEINNQSIINKLIFTGEDSSLLLKFKINVSPYLIGNDQINLFPNPILNQELHLETKSNSSLVSYFIYTIQGHIVYKKEIRTEHGYAQLSVPISDWKSGQYIVKMKSESGEAKSTFLKIKE